MNRSKLLSVVITCHNQGKYLQELLTIIDYHSGHFLHTEFIIIDSSEVPEKFSFLTEHKYLRIDNKGPSFARNRGVEIATGYWVLFCDADDFISPHIELFLFSQIESLNSDAYFFPFQRLDNELFQTDINFVYRENIKISLQLIKSPVYFLQHFYPVHSVLLKRAVFETIKFDESCWLVEDVRFYIDLYNSKYKLSLVIGGDNYVSFHRDFHDRITLSRSNEKEFWQSVCQNYQRVSNHELGAIERCKIIYLTACNYHVVSSRELKLLMTEKLRVIWYWYFGFPRTLKSKYFFRLIALFVAQRKIIWNK
jgi:glycosyltransferase involved in cell wall biosynthesis